MDDRKNGVSFGIIMPCYNSEEYLEAAVKSVLDQEYTNWELIAVNDGSTDGTADLLAQFAGKDDRIRVYRKENGGYCSAINYGLELVKTDYFLFMGSDDRLKSTLLKDLAVYIDEYAPDMIAFRTLRYVDGTNEGVDAFTAFDEVCAEQNCTIKDFEQAHQKEATIFSIRDTSRCYKTDVLADLRYFGQYGYDADGIFSMLFAHRSHSFVCVPVDGYLWTLRKDSLSGKPTTTKVDCDRLEDWILFYRELLQLRSSEITGRELLYIDQLLNLAKKFSSRIRLSEKKYMDVLLRSAEIIKRASEYFNHPIGKNARRRAANRMFLMFPRLWVIKNSLTIRR